MRIRFTTTPCHGFPVRVTIGCSPWDKECGGDEMPAHEVTITKGFWMGQTPVTEAAYARCPKASGISMASADPDLPVVNVSWEDARSYCGWTGLRLPTEAEWEYAARASTTGSRHGALDDVAWHRGYSGGKLHPVRGKQPNPWGLYDMLGNVWEWVADWFGDYGKEAAVEPSGPTSGVYRVLRGGCWSEDPGVVRASYRGRDVPSNRNFSFGFRCARDELYRQ